MIDTKTLAPVSGSQSKFYLQIFGVEETLPIISFDFSKEIEAAKGEGTINIHYTKEIYNQILNYSEIIVSLGWNHYGGKEEVAYYLFGFISEIGHDGNEITLKIVDLGVMLEQNAAVTYTQKKRSEILKDIIKKAGLIPEIDFTGVSDDVIDYSSLESSSTESLQGGSVSGAGTNSCGRCGLTWGKWYQSTVVNKCPSCGKTGTIVWLQGDQMNFCGGNDWEGKYEGHYFCCLSKGGCDADWCICGRNHTRAYKDLTVISPPKEVNAPITLSQGALTFTSTEKKEDTTTDSSGTETTTDMSSTNSEGKTFWDMILELLDPIGHDLQVFNWLDRVFIRRVPSPTDANLFIDGKINLLEDTLTIEEGSPFCINTVVVNYGGKTHPKQYVAVDNRLKDKYGEIKEKINMYNYNAEDAAAFAWRTLQKKQRDNKFVVNADVIGHPEWYIGRWTKIKSERHNVDDTLYITAINPRYSADINLECGLTLNEYFPNIEVNTRDSEGAGNGNLDAIMQQASKFGYCGCSTGTCMDSKAHCGDCFAMSDWLYRKLSAAGYQVRIVAYRTYVPEHRSVQIFQGGSWRDLPYKSYPFDQRFRATSNKPGFHIYRG